MRWTALLIVVAFSCHDSSMDMGIVHGVPEGVTIRCAEFHDASGMCVGTNGKSYGCVANRTEGCSVDRYDCAEVQIFNHHTTESTTVYVNSP